MRYIKLYEKFEIRVLPEYNNNLSLEDLFGKTISQGNDKEETIREICLELEDEGYDININRRLNKNNAMVITRNREKLVWGEIKEYLLRIKDYLGDDYIDCNYLDWVEILDNLKVDISKPPSWIKIDLNEETTIDELNSIAIHYRDKTYN